MQTHSVERKTYQRSKKFNAQAASYSIKLKNLDGKTYLEICHQFQDIMKRVLDDVLEGSKPEDMVRLNVHSSRFNTGDINTKFQVIKNSNNNNFYISYFFFIVKKLFFLKLSY